MCADVSFVALVDAPGGSYPDPTLNADGLYIDAEDVGLARATSHPRFNALANEDFFVDCGDDFSPFGNDDGSDTLAAFQDWLVSGGTDVDAFIALMDAEWDLPRPARLDDASDEELAAWVAADPMHDRYLASHANVRIAVAFGQLKTGGEVEPRVGAKALRALKWKRLLNAVARRENPSWSYAELESTRIESMAAVLLAASSSP